MTDCCLLLVVYAHTGDTGQQRPFILNIIITQHKFSELFEKLDLAFNNVKPKDRYFVLD